MSGPIEVKTLDPVIELQQRLAGLHSALERCHPIAVVRDAEFHIYDLDEAEDHYRYIQSNPLPVPIPEGVRAAFPLNEYGGRMACVVSMDVFDELDGYVTVLHEFVHCYQYSTCETRLKNGLNVTKQDEAAGEMMWEIQYSFPYEDPVFVNLFSRFLSAVNEGLLAEVEEIHKDLRMSLAKPDFEYLVWQEWKEGFARYIENQIQEALGLPLNLGGGERPFNRVSFYPAGAAFINLFERESPGTIRDLQTLFRRLLQAG
jgi:hypothetical protein